MSNPMSYEGRNVVVTGAYSGVGAALVELLADLGAASITALDIKEPAGPITRFIPTNMGDPVAVDGAAAAIDAPVHVLFNNAGIAATFSPEDVMKVNTLGLMRLTDALLPKIPAGGAVVNTASIAGMNWPAHQAEITELLSIDNWDKAVAWVEEHPEVVADGYMFSKECVQIFTMQAAKGMLANGVRIASACPAPIDTPLLPDFKKTMGEGMIDWTAANAGGRYVTAAEVANLLAYLGSDAASFVSGVNVNIDNAFQGSMITGQVDFEELAG
ncbi:coniferyl-alcohol dehydrogenase [Candidatus Poriferisocius sp.]|uniref:coniferyl-alcohol dehydrogenase n=1 Tax=Candidatus Poriferisocius sp. TaxID=3101276 RepID=UPI003B028296